MADTRENCYISTAEKNSRRVIFFSVPVEMITENGAGEKRSEEILSLRERVTDGFCWEYQDIGW